jgi:mRNA degradation ribonuclease J1/J2
MPHAQVADSLLGEALQRVYEYKRLAVMVRTMAREIERLNEDNQQLRAATRVYREVVRRQKVMARVGRQRS